MKKFWELQKQKKDYKKIIVLFGCGCFLLLTLLYIGLLYNNINAERTRYGYIAKNEAEHIITLVDCVMARTTTLEVMLQDHNGETEWFDKVAKNIYDDVTDETGVSLKNFAIAPDGVVSKVYPLEGNEALVGFDFLDTSRKGNLEAKEAYEKGTTILTNPFELVQGGIGMGGRSPVILRDGDTETLWGLVTVTIDFENMIEVLRLDNLEGMGVDYAISYIDQDGTPVRIHAVGDPGENAVKTRFAVRNLTWEIAVVPKKGWILPWRVILSMLIILILSLFGGIFANMVIILHENNAMLRRLAVTDGLTGCMNRLAFEKRIGELRENGIDKDFVYISADVNGLKQCNDTLGHPAGDELLVGASACMRESFEPYGKVYRIGGDEFAALLLADQKTLDEIMKKVQDLTEHWEGEMVKHISVAFGHATHSEFPDATIDTLITTVDERMYEVKREYYQHHTREVIS